MILQEHSHVLENHSTEYDLHILYYWIIKFDYVLTAIKIEHAEVNKNETNI